MQMPNSAFIVLSIKSSLAIKIIIRELQFSCSAAAIIIGCLLFLFFILGLLAV